MREPLRKLSESEYWVYGVSEYDFEYAVKLAQKLVQGQFDLFNQYAEKVRHEQPEMADDILDDPAYYTFIDGQYVWHFALWRLQAVLEGLIVYTFLKRTSGDGLDGLKKKLDAMVAAGFNVSDADRDELLAWARLRNALSHAPPESYRPGPLTEADVLEYRDLVVRLCRDWRGKDG